MKAVFTAINSKFTHTALPVYILSKCAPKSIESKALEFNINQTKDYIVKKLYEENADIYLFSCYIWNISMILSICGDLKKMKECIIILGGSEVSYNPRDYVGKYADYVVCGEGENIIAPLLIKISEGKDATKLSGVYDINKTAPNEFTQKTSPEDMIFPYTDEELEIFKDKILYYESSRGCPHQCTYCLSGWDNKVRYKDVETTCSELLRFINAGVRQVKFIDRTFNAHPKRAEEIVEFIIQNNKKTNFHFEVTAEHLTDRLMELLASAPTGMFQIEVGLQSINEKTLSSIKRRNDPDRFSQNILTLLKNENVHVHGDIIAGLPYENYDSFMKGIDFLFDLKVHMLQVGILKVLKGSEIYEQAEEYEIKYSDTPPYNALSSKWLSIDDMINIGYIEDIVEKYYNSMSFSESLDKIAQYFNTPHEMFEALAEYFKVNGYFDRGISKRELYEILISFAKKNNIPAQREIILDGLKFLDIYNPTDDIIKKYDKTKIFALLNDEEFVNTYLSAYADMRPKEIFKHISVYEWASELLILTKEKEKSVKNGYRHFFINMPETL